MRLVLWLVLSPILLPAQNFRSMPKMKLVPKLDQPWTAAPTVRSGRSVITTGPAVTESCVIPLLVARPQDVDPKMVMPAPSKVEPNLPEIHKAPICGASSK